VLGDDGWAELGAITETTRASTAAALAWYAAGTVDATEWVTAMDQNVCGTCQDNSDAGPVPLGQVFPSGDEAPPAHPGCRCAAAPVTLPGSDLFGPDMLELADKPGKEHRHHADTDDHHGQYTAADIGVPALREISVDPRVLHVDHEHYQRRADPQRTAAYAGEPRKKLRSRVGLVAVRPDGTMWIVNGQHHTAAAIKRGVHTMRYEAFRSTGWRMEKRVYLAWERWHAANAHT
jgi:hypothetical protein